LPWAAQTRELLVARWLEELFGMLFSRRMLFPAEGGRFRERSLCGADDPELFGMLFCKRMLFPAAEGGRFRERSLRGADDPELLGMLFCKRMLFPAAEGGRFRERSFCRTDVPVLFREWFPAEFAGKFPDRPGVRPLVFMVWNRKFDAAEPGAVRAMTGRFSTEEGGREALPLVFAAPKALCFDGETPRLVVTRAPRSVASLKWMPLRLMAWPPANALREVAVTAWVLCA
jgi:hypothetical protein